MLGIEFCVKKSVRVYVYLSPKWAGEGGWKIDMVEIQCTETAEYILFKTQHQQKYASHEKKLQIKIVGNWISYKKVRERITDFSFYTFVFVY